MSGKSISHWPLPTPMNLSLFQLKLKFFWKLLKKAEPDLLDVHVLFTRKREIWPDQCEKVLVLLSSIKLPIEGIRTLLENPAMLPFVVLQQRHLLLMNILHSDERLKSLLTEISEFHMLCLMPSKETPKMRQKIEHNLNVLLREFHEVLENTSLLLDRLHFQKKSI